MAETSQSQATSVDTLQAELIRRFVRSLEQGLDWPCAMLEAMAAWTAAAETVEDRSYTYLIGGEAFDWLVLAERLFEAVDGMIPEDEKEDLLFNGRFPSSFDTARFKQLLGADKYRGYLNFFYGVIVEEALQLAVEQEVYKRHLSRGIQYEDDFSEEAFSRIYREPKEELLRRFRSDMRYPAVGTTSLDEAKEFSYWLFKFRMSNSDKAKIASDTKKGLLQLQKLRHLRGAVTLM